MPTFCKRLANVGQPTPTITQHADLQLTLAKFMSVIWAMDIQFSYLTYILLVKRLIKFNQMTMTLTFDLLYEKKLNIGYIITFELYYIMLSDLAFAFLESIFFLTTQTKLTLTFDQCLIVTLTLMGAFVLHKNPLLLCLIQKLPTVTEALYGAFVKYGFN